MPTLISFAEFGGLTRRHGTFSYKEFELLSRAVPPRQAFQPPRRNGMLPKDETIYKNRKQVKPK